MASVAPFTPRFRVAPPPPPPSGDVQVASCRMNARDGLQSLPICRYGDRCLRTNPQHYRDFAHPGRPAAFPLGSEPSASLPSRPARPALTPRATLRFRPVERPRRCKFGCGQPANPDTQAYTQTCCRTCGLCQGAGDHDGQCAGGWKTTKIDDTGSGTSDCTEDAEAVSIMTLDHALELCRKAKSYETAGDASRARALMSDSAEQMERARAKMPEGSRLTHLLDSVLTVLQDIHGGENPMGSLEETIDAELDRVIAVLDGALATSLPAAADARSSDAGLWRPENTNTIGHVRESTEPSLHLAVPSLALDVIHDEVVKPSEPSPETAGGTRSRAETESPASPSRSHPAQAALRALRLDDEWPTDLTRGEIRRRYMREALLCHPDKGPTEEKLWRTSRFQELSDAYTTMEVYITVLERMRRGTGEAAPPPPPPAPPAPPAESLGLEDPQYAVESGSGTLGPPDVSSEFPSGVPVAFAPS